LVALAVQLEGVRLLYIYIYIYIYIARTRLHRSYVWMGVDVRANVSGQACCTCVAIMMSPCPLAVESWIKLLGILDQG
jgi:hypothetical protein